MIESSKDILYVVLSFCILWATVFLCWVFYYLGKILKNTSKIIEEFRSRLQLLTEAVNYIRGKVENLTALITCASSGVSGLVKGVVTRKANEWMEKGEGKFNEAAKDAVDKAVEATANKMSSMANKIKKS